jgi:hypothetical protein
MKKSMTIYVMMVLVVLAVRTPSYAETPEELLAIHSEQVAAINSHDIDAMMSHFADDSIYFLVSQPPPGPKPLVRMAFESRFQARPDFRMTEGRTFAAGNIVVEEAETLFTEPDTGVEVVIPHLSIFEFEGDKIKKVTTYNNSFSAMIATGMIPAPEIPNLVPSGNVPDPEATGLSPMEANAELVNRWNSHDAADLARMDHADYQIYAGPLDATLDRVAMTALNELYFTAFPDAQLEIVRAIDLGDGWVLTEIISKGTHEGEFMGVPSSGYLTGLRLVWLTRYDADGLATEQSFYYDNLTLFNQMTTPPYSLDGIWMTSFPTPLGNLISSTLYTAQDDAKTRYSGSLELINPKLLLAGIFPDAEPSKEIWAGGHVEMVGRDSYEGTYLGYIRKTIESDMVTGIEIIGLVTVNVHFELIGPDFLYGMGNGSYYMADQDADKDGFPDEGEEPVSCIPWMWTSKRLTVMPGCQLIP